MEEIKNICEKCNKKEKLLTIMINLVMNLGYSEKESVYLIKEFYKK